MGVNVGKGAVPSTDILRFPGISLEHILGATPDRLQLLHDILASFISLRPHMRTDSFMASWEKSLAWQGQDVRVELGADKVVYGKIAGLESDGSLRVKDERGKTVTVRFGDVRLRLFS
jgi:biotin-(acetyl-CoA carboxylase) ligase